MVEATNIQTQRKSKKLDHNLRGKFRIKELIGKCAFKLKFGPGMGKIHPVFHISLLKPYHTNTIPGRRTPTPPPVDIDQNTYELDAIPNSNIKNRKVLYLVS